MGERLPKDGERNILVTSALPYVNNVPHLGNVVGSVLSADIYARFCRNRGYNVLYVCGTDEYGTTTEVKAAMENLSPREICDKYHHLHKEIYDFFDISFDEFGRTSTPEHTAVCQDVFISLLKNDFLKDDIIDQLYCEACLKFLADKFVEGECPRCGMSCIGDQCEHCGAFLNALDVLNPICTICRSSSLKVCSTEHLFLKVASMHEELCDHFKRTEILNQQAQKDTINVLDNEMLPKCITRDLKWGVPVPVEKFKEKVMYVWFDAPLGYASITKCHTSKWELWWKNPENVELHQFMGKDNVTFHTVLFPSYLIGTRENWTLPHSIHATHFLLFGGGKFSKSKGIGVFGDDAKESGIPVEVWRYYLVSVRPEANDSTFSWEDLQAKLNNELTNNLGNFIHRVLSIIAKPPGRGYDFIIPDAPDAVPSETDNDFVANVRHYVQEYVNALEKGKLKDGLKAAMSLATEGNRYLQKSAVWNLFIEDSLRCSFVVKTLVGVVCILTCLLQPYMPSFTTEVLKQLKMEAHLFRLRDEDIEMAQTPWEIVPAGHIIGNPRVLFKKMDTIALKDIERKIWGRQTARRENALVLNKSKFEVKAM